MMMKIIVDYHNADLKLFQLVWWSFDDLRKAFADCVQSLSLEVQGTLVVLFLNLREKRSSLIIQHLPLKL